MSIPLYFVQSLLMQTIMNCFPMPPPPPLVKSWIRQCLGTMPVFGFFISFVPGISVVFFDFLESGEVVSAGGIVVFVRDLLGERVRF